MAGSGLPVLPPGIGLRRHDDIDSTNLEARRLCEQGEVGPLWIWAGWQTAGRGRLDRHWQSGAGNLFATLLTPCDAPFAAAGQVSFAAGLALRDAVLAVAPGLDLRLKWPNDLLLDGAKLSGILVESLAAAGDRVRALAIGCGVNLATHPEAGTSWPATSLAARGMAVAPGELLARLAPAMQARLAQWADGAGAASLFADWSAAAAGIGEAMTVEAAGRRETGVFAGLAPDGAIELDTAAGRRAFHAGDVVSARPVAVGSR